MNIDSSKTVGVIGGNGKTGGQFADLFRAFGCEVETTGSKDFQRNAALIENCDIVVFAVPLKSSTEIIKGDIQYATREDQLILDVCSLKAPQCKAMKKAAGEVIGMHPLFGPTTDTKGQTVVLCPEQCSDETLQSLKDFFSSHHIHTKEMEAEEHDTLMSLLQALPHLKSFLIADTLHNIGGTIIDTIDETATPAYRIELNLVGRFLDDSPDLYGPIILQNPETLSLLSYLHQSLGEVIEMAESQDLKRFSEKYNTLKEFFGKHTEEGREKTEKCIRTLSNS